MATITAKCIKGSPNRFRLTDGGYYDLDLLTYHEIDGDFYISVKNDTGEPVQVKADRFDLLPVLINNVNADGFERKKAQEKIAITKPSLADEVEKLELALLEADRLIENPTRTVDTYLRFRDRTCIFTTRKSALL